MSKVTLNSLTGDYASNALLNANFTALTTALENTLSRDGTSPNTMGADFDLNSYDILNGGVGNFTNIVVGGTSVAAQVSAAAASAAAALVSENNAASSESNALTYYNNTLGVYNTYHNQYLGSFASEPTLENDGSALTTGDLYFDTVLGQMKVYTGSAWSLIATIAGIVSNATATAMTITSAQKIGIGISTPDVLMHLWSGSAGTVSANAATLLALESAVDAYFQILTPATQTQKILFSDPSADSGIVQYDHSTDEMSFWTNAAKRLTINTAGNVGIDVAPSAIGSGYNSLQLGANLCLMGNTTGADSYIIDNGYWDGTNYKYLVNGYASRLNLNSSGVFTVDAASSGIAGNSITWLERMRIDSSGKVGIGTTPAYPLHVSYNISNNIANFTNGAIATPYGPLIYFNGSAPNNTTSYFLSGLDTSTTRFYIYSNGNMVNTNNSYGAISDQKLKQDITDAASQWNDLKNIRVRKFRLISDVEANPDANYHIGLIAQEAQVTSPGLVDSSPDMDANNQPTGTETLSVKYSVLFMKAVKALQEAQTRIETLETQNTNLKALLVNKNVITQVEADAL